MKFGGFSFESDGDLERQFLIKYRCKVVESISNRGEVPFFPNACRLHNTKLIKRQT